jgi:RNA polymerase sigma-54 factor
MLRSYQDNRKSMSRDVKEAVLFVKQKIDSAKWFIDAIRQRQETLMLVMTEILMYQKDYFVEGDETKMRPMILKDIADRTGLDISTISRVSNSKYIQTHFGIYPLKYFFSESMQKDTGEEVSTREIKSILQECIENESKRKPLNDDELTQILNDKGYEIARRTVAKYREQLDIPVARMRKEL